LRGLVGVGRGGDIAEVTDDVAGGEVFPEAVSDEEFFT
jgi:hypothetical protein